MERAGLVSIIGSNIICKSKSKMTLFYRALCMLAFTPVLQWALFLLVFQWELAHWLVVGFNTVVFCLEMHTSCLLGTCGMSFLHRRAPVYHRLHVSVCLDHSALVYILSYISIAEKLYTYIYYTYVICMYTYLFTCVSVRSHMRIVYVRPTCFHLAVVLLYHTLLIPFWWQCV
jgi:hypothetical protein